MGAQEQYNYYRSVGMTHAGALAMNGNGDCESNLVPYRLQGDFSNGFSRSKEYTRKVDSGEIGRYEFVYGGPGGGGYGIYQWTYSPRKAELYDAAKKQGKSIGDEMFQLAFSVTELKRDFASLWNLLCSSDDLYRCVNDVCYKFENPAVKNVGVRYNAALRIEKTLQPYNPTPTPEPEPPKKETYWPPRVVDKNMSGSDVEVLQAVLKARGFDINFIDGKFGDVTDAAVRGFQFRMSLDVDGVVGKATWRALLDPEFR